MFKKMNNHINNLFQKSINLDQIKKLDKKQLNQVLKILKKIK